MNGSVREARLEAQRKFASSFDPTPRAAEPTEELLDRCGFEVFRDDAMDSQVQYLPKQQRVETKDEAFARRFLNLMPKNRERYRRIARIVLETAGWRS